MVKSDIGEEGGEQCQKSKAKTNVMVGAVQSYFLFSFILSASQSNPSSNPSPLMEKCTR